MELLGTCQGDIKIFDDFAHNPDKISASIKALKNFGGRVIIIYQQHGYKPLQMMRKELAAAFYDNLDSDDIVMMPEVYFAGGTVERSITAKDFINDLKALGLDARYYDSRDEIKQAVGNEAKSNDRIVIMGARDDTLHDFAREIMEYIC